MGAGRKHAGLLAGCFAVAGAACGDNALPPGVERSGSRIRAMYLVDAEGDRVFRGWYDRELGTECTWTGGDAPRCLPPYTETGVFVDANCEQPALEVARAVPPEVEPPLPAYLGVRRGACPEALSVGLWTVDAEARSPLFVWGRNPVNGECVGRPADYVTYAYHPGAQALPGEMFAGGVVEELGPNRIQTRTIIGDDGALVPLEAFDRDLGVACTSERDRGCFPAGSFSGIAEDATCTKPILVALTACDPPSVIVHTRTEPTTLFERGEVLTDDPEEVVIVYEMGFIIVGQGWSCTERQVSVVAGRTLYRAGAEIPLERLAPVKEITGDGKRIRPIWLQSGSHLRVTGYRDVMLDLECSVTELVPGAWYCLPPLTSVWRRFFYADAACNEPLALGFDYGDHTPVLEVRDEAGVPTAHLYELGAVRAPGTYFWKSGTACMPWSEDDHGVEITAHELGPEISLGRFPALSPVTE